MSSSKRPTIAPAATEAVRRHRPDVVVLDVHMPGGSGLDLCRDLKADPATDGISVVLLRARTAVPPNRLPHAGADAFLRKPFSPLELLSIVERLAGGLRPVPFRASRAEACRSSSSSTRAISGTCSRSSAASACCSRRATGRRSTALATALETKDSGTAIHSQRVQHYAIELAARRRERAGGGPERRVRLPAPRRGQDRDPGPHPPEARAAEAGGASAHGAHTILGEQMLGGVAFLQGAGLEVVRSHHERWDGDGYPDRLARKGHPGRCARLRGRGHPRRDDERPPVPARPSLGLCRGRDPPPARRPVRPRGRACVSGRGTAAQGRVRRSQHRLSHPFRVSLAWLPEPIHEAYAALARTRARRFGRRRGHRLFRRGRAEGAGHPRPVHDGYGRRQVGLLRDAHVDVGRPRRHRLHGPHARGRTRTASAGATPTRR